MRDMAKGLRRNSKGATWVTEDFFESWMQLAYRRPYHPAAKPMYDSRNCRNWPSTLNLATMIGGASDVLVGRHFTIP